MVKTSGPRPVKATVSDVTATRALDTNYQNNTGRPLLVIVTVNCTRAAVAAAMAVAEGKTNPSLPLGIRARCGFLASAVAADGMFCMTFAVTPGHRYAVDTTINGAGSGVNLQKWVEVEL